MTTRKVNETLTQVGPGTPMGQLLREYWLPVMRSERLAERGGAPVPVELLGEKYVLFRGDDGSVGCFAEACPHRGASLALARNEDCSLRCVYHGWKFHVSGTVLETPSEPEEDGPRFADRVKLPHHPVVEAGGIVWVWLGGTGRKPGPFPEFPFTKVPAENVFATIALVDCNWLQGVEADIDSAHVSLLHETEARNGPLKDLLDDTAPRDEIDPRPYGLRFAAVRSLSSGDTLARVKPFAMPWYTVVPELPNGDRLWHAWVPVDDHRTIMWYLWWNDEQPVDPGYFSTQFGLDLDTLNPDNIREGYTRENGWGQDRAAMRAGTSFSGIRGLVLQDVAVQESMGPIVDRTRENPGKSDRGIVRVRRFLLDALKTHAAGGVAAGLGDDADYGAVRSAVVVAPRGTDWRAAAPA
ncbi:Rieske 2Fe-2S domain-containing protein [Streptomyces sp. LP05-1]|uniref:Rieske 2Fe-2S domain-containing protein n=1 Tax=Streptomyces pyxinae TaxID=2970734 RepID=A0ABT2CSV3_9ACTN|nr:Rieske 2Fe-2S domain-containing protein [Streptomyces sp. LP05-1]MCS0639649.1 Rieske 2Fe-2S domain-containing protein [Streptomyces sp. LP05-1]